MNFMDNNHLIENISKEFSLNKITASILLERGYSSFDEINSFLYPSEENLSDPYELLGMNEAVLLIQEHFSKNSKILIYGDYDCDGVGAAAILYLAFEKAGVIPEVFLPNREEDGYGLKTESIKKMLHVCHPDLILTVDCGIQSIEEVKYLNKLGIDVIITDHHEPGTVLPDCICINPKIQNVHDELSGAGVAFMLIYAMLGKKEALNYVDICAVSTVSDLVPLLGNNRIIVSLGLKKINNENSKSGLSALIDSVMRKTDKNTIVKSSDIAYKIGPRINASGRITSASKSFNLLISKDFTEINHIIYDLETENKYRQELCISTIDNVRNMLIDYDLSTHRVIVLFNGNWEAGVVGIAASKIAEEFNKPTILLTKINDCVKGSCRSIKGINIFDMLKANSHFLIQYGGHEMAAGLSIDFNNINSFIESCDLYINQNFKPEIFKNRQDDQFILNDLSDVSVQLAKELSLLEPYGMNNRKPLFSLFVDALKFLPINSYPHIKYELSRNVKFIGFNKIDYLDLLKSDTKKLVKFSINLDSFRNREYASCDIFDISVVSYNFENNLLVYNDLVRYISPNSGEIFKNVFMPNDFFGRIILVWNYNNLVLAMEKYPNYILKYMKLNSNNTYNTILFSPNRDECFRYFSEIIIFDNPPKKYVDYLLNKYSNITIISSINLFQNKYCIDLNKSHLNMTYSFLSSYLPTIIDSHSEEYIFSYLVSKGLTISILMFKLCCIILLELGYINIDKNTLKWSLSHSSKKMEESLIYNRLKD